MSQQVQSWGLPTIITMLGGVAIISTLTPSIADGYPGGTSVSVGVNPVVAKGGHLTYSGDSQIVFTAPTDQNIVVTDVVLTGGMSDYDCRGQSRVTLSTESTSAIASFSVDQRGHGYSSTGVITAHYESGLPVLAGETLTIQTGGNFRSCGSSSHFVDYSVSGYLAQP